MVRVPVHATSLLVYSAGLLRYKVVSVVILIFDTRNRNKRFLWEYLW